jgi:hypothetical protein
MSEKKYRYYKSVVIKYIEYLRLYKFINHGSLEGHVPFDYFYWNYCYYYRSFDIQRYQQW